MKNLFSIGEVARQQNISRQTLIFYDKIGLFCPAYTDPKNGYRYYSAAQLDALDTICIMKRIGFSLDEIKNHMKSYTLEQSLAAFERQLSAIERQISELQLLYSRVAHRCTQLEHAASIRGGDAVTVERVPAQQILVHEVQPPYSLEQVSMATKECFVRSFRERLPIYFQSGAVVPLRRILDGQYTAASHVFLPIEAKRQLDGVQVLPEGVCVSTYHTGDYGSIGSAYERILAFCREHAVPLLSDSYEFAINDYLSTKDESEYITKILIYTDKSAYGG